MFLISNWTTEIQYLLNYMNFYFHNSLRSGKRRLTSDFGMYNCLSGHGETSFYHCTCRLKFHVCVRLHWPSEIFMTIEFHFNWTCKRSLWKLMEEGKLSGSFAGFFELFLKQDRLKLFWKAVPETFEKLRSKHPCEGPS